MANFSMTERVKKLRMHSPSSLGRAPKPVVSSVVLPTQLFYAWYDASDSSSVLTAPNNEIIAWNDKSLNNNHLTSIISSPPTYNTETQKGHKVVTFSSPGSICRTSMNIPATSQTWFMVCKIAQITATPSSIMSYINSADQGRSSWQIYAYDEQCFIGALAKGLPAPLSAITLEYDKPRSSGGQCMVPGYHLFEVVVDREGLTTSIFLDGTLKDSKPDNLTWNPLLGTFKMFANRAGNQFCLGAVAETICMGSTDPNNRKIVQAYLTKKWM